MSKTMKRKPTRVKATKGWVQAKLDGHPALCPQPYPGPGRSKCIILWQSDHTAPQPATEAKP